MCSSLAGVLHAQCIIIVLHNTDTICAYVYIAHINVMYVHTILYNVRDQY